MHRHKSLSLRSPQATSLGRATGFNTTTVKEFFTNLIQLRPFPKAGPRKSIYRRKLVKSRILTDTPIKKQIAKEHAIRELKKRKNPQCGKITKKQKCKKFVSAIQSSESDENEEMIPTMADMSDDDIFTESNAITEGDFVLVKFTTKASDVHYVSYESIHSVS